MAGGERILIAAALAKIIQPVLAREFSNSALVFAEDGVAVERVVSERMRFDVVVTDLTWNDYTLDFSFDGLDVLDILRKADKATRVVIAAQGHGIERDHLDEAVEQPEVAGIFRKALGPEILCHAIHIVADGKSLPATRFPPGDSLPEVPRIHRYFSKGKGITAARMAGAIASGRAVNHETLASATAVGHGTANRLVDYLGPLIEDRGEHFGGLKMTPEVVYRWCGEHARYILSWCRRKGPHEFGARVVERE
jgi:CheY-like chemotaxis protein